MRLDILSDLKKYQDLVCLCSKRTEKNNIVDRDRFSLYQLTKVKLEKILSSVNSSSGRLNIIIAESNSIEFLATFMAGVIAEVNLFLCDPHWQQQEWQQVLNLVHPDLIFAQQEVKNSIDRFNNIDGEVLTATRNIPQESLIMIPTGGSSGKIKFAMHAWSTLATSVDGFKKYFNCQAINSFCTLPLYHVSGLMQFMRSFLTQGNIIICSYKIIETQQFVFKRKEYFISLVPTQLQSLIESSPSWLAEFKTVLLGGASISRSLLDRARKCQISLAPSYGMTETASQVVTLKPDDFLAGNNSNGEILPHAEIVIKPEAENQAGLIKIKCDSLCLGYYPQVFTDSYLFATDDLGYLDNRGYLYLLGRNSQKIITGGENVFPAEVEEVILATKLVKDICAIGTSDLYWGQIVTAVYVPLESKQDLDLIKSKIKTKLAKYKHPKKWIAVDRLPRNNRGKINYKKVKAIVNNK